MKKYLLRVVFFLSLVSVIAWGISHYFNEIAGFVFLFFCFFLYLYKEACYFKRFESWALKVQQDPPVDSGRYEDIVTALYKYTRSQAKQVKKANTQSQGVSRAGHVLPMGVILLDSEFKMTWFNHRATEYVGVQPRDEGQVIFNLIRFPEFYQFVEQRMAATPEELLEEHYFKTVIQTHGVKRSIRFRIFPFGRSEKLLLLEDRTRIEKLQNIRQEFVDNISHELKTPLTVLLGFFEILQDQIEHNAFHLSEIAQEQLWECFEPMQKQATRMQAIVNDLLSLSSLESLSVRLEPWCMMHELIVAGVEQAKELATEQHRFELNVSDQLCIQGNPTELRSAINNLLFNAVMYSPQGGLIRVSWYQEGQEAVLSVQDQGIGIHKKDIPRVTERFYRVDTSRSRQTGGTGLGLAIVKHVMIRHHGQLEIESRFGEGSTFALRFPLGEGVESKESAYLREIED